MALRKIVIFGVTGNQGASVAKALLADKQNEWDVWGVTRNPDSASSKKQADLGVKLVKGDLDDPSTYAKALDGAYGTFINANFWIAYNGSNSKEAEEIEYKQCAGAVDAAIAGGVKHVVFSTLDHCDPPVPHFESKQRVTKYMKDKNVPGTQLYTAYFFPNIVSLLRKTHEKDGKRVLPLPMPDDSVVPGFNPHQIGLWVRAAFADPKWIGKDMYACGENIKVSDFAKVLSELSGKPFDSEHITHEQFNESRKTMDHEMWLNYNAFVTGQMPRNMDEILKVVPDAQDFRTYAKATPELMAQLK